MYIYKLNLYVLIWVLFEWIEYVIYKKDCPTQNPEVSVAPKTQNMLEKNETTSQTNGELHSSSFYNTFSFPALKTEEILRTLPKTARGHSGTTKALKRNKNKLCINDLDFYRWSYLYP